MSVYIHNMHTCIRLHNNKFKNEFNISSLDKHKPNKQPYITQYYVNKDEAMIGYCATKTI